MAYRRADDELFGKYCYIDTPWIAGKHTIYRIIRSGVRSNSWCEVPINGLTKKVNHGEHTEDIVFVVLDTLIDEDAEIMGVALKDVEIIGEAEQTENSSEKPNSCGHITEDGVTCAKYPACDDCLDNPLNKVKGSERLVKSSEQTDCQTCKWWSSYGYCVHRECKGYEPKTERSSE